MIGDSADDKAQQWVCITLSVLPVEKIISCVLYLICYERKEKLHR